MNAITAHLRPRRLGAAAVALTLAGTALAAAPAPASAATAPPVVSITQSPLSASLGAGSLGFSFEASDLARPGFTSGNLAS